MLHILALTIILTGSVTMGTKVVIIPDFIVHEVEESYVSFVTDTDLLDQSKRSNSNFSYEKLETLMKALSPAILRYGGSPADWTVFAESDKNAEEILNKTGILPPLTVFTSQDLDNMVELSLKTNTKFLYDLNLQLRYGEQWDPTNTMTMFDYMQKKGYGSNVDFELGNEPAYYDEPGEQHVIPAKVVGEDFVRLYKLMRAYPNLDNSYLVGPDVVSMQKSGLDIINQVAEEAGEYLRAVTFHHYYFRGDTAHVKDYLDHTKYDDLENKIKLVSDAIKKSSHPNLQIWIGETADSWHGGTANVTDRYISGFLWLDKLGIAATHGVSVLMRQTFYGNNYGLLDFDANPNPDYWLSWLHKNLVGTKVLSAVYWSDHPTTRVYAHCTNTKKTNYPEGSVTMFALNIDTNYTDTLMIYPPFHNQSVDMYMFTPPTGDSDGILSKKAAVNGKVLMLENSYTLPIVTPVKVDSSNGLKLPPLTMAFYVFPQVNAKACM